ncbi:hypothetical protein GF340_02640 [Candidatus Peregrinibacteria bacterium]|nr:hypothetical protein [Candidatus Peregrinibacteria bacterium]
MDYLSYIPAAIFAFLLTLSLTVMALHFFPKWGLIDRPHKYGLKRKPIPYYGGLVLFAGFAISTLLFVPYDVHVVSFLFAAGLLVATGFVDDYTGLSPHFRLFVQLIAALILVLSGIGIMSISNPLGDAITFDYWRVTIESIGIYEISVVGAIFTVIWVMTLTNTMNFLDGLNGLPSGVAIIAGLTLFALSVRPDIHFDASSQMPVATMSLILASTALAFWLFDFYPAKILMGDTGSTFLGFTIAVLAIFSGGKVATALLVLGFPILDTIWVILRRIVQGKSPMQGDLKHFHHRLLKIGLTDRQALMLIYLLSLMFGGIAVFLEGINKFYALIAMGVLMIILGGLAVYLQGKKEAKDLA